MFSSLATKAALKKVGLPSDTFDFSSWKTPTSSESSSGGSKSSWKKLTKSKPVAVSSGDSAAAAGNGNGNGWPEWMSIRSLPLTVQPWLTPRPPPVPIADPPRVGDLAPLDKDRQLEFGGRRKVLVVFLRCVGCAFAQKTFLALRALASFHPPTTLTCIAISHASAAATRAWLDLLPPTTTTTPEGGVVVVRGAGRVQIVIDEPRALYAAWGLGLGSVWYVLHPTAQAAAFREKGWLGEKVAGSVGVRKMPGTGTGTGTARGEGSGRGKGSGVGGGRDGGENGEDRDEDKDKDKGPVTTMGNKWQEAGAWAVDGAGRVVWGGKALRADDVLDLEAGVRALGVRA